MRTVVVVCVIAVAAHAEPPTDAPRPWAIGVSPERQAEALRLFGEGNQVFEQGQYAQALSAYRKAVAAWDHPAIRYNMAVALIQLDEPLAAYENLMSSLRWDGEALEPQLRNQALIYKKLLLAQLAQLTVGCHERGAKVFLDGNELLEAPGEVTRVLVPGTHLLVAAKPGFMTVTRRIALVSGHASVETVELVAMNEPRRSERRWKWWKPVAVAAAGAVVAAAGVPLLLDAQSNDSQYDSAIAQQCPHGCPASRVPSTTRDLESSANLERDVAIALFVTGGTVAAVGLALVIANQRVERPAQSHALALAPLVGRDGVGMALVGRF